MKYIEKSRQRNRIRIMVAIILNFLIFLASLSSWMIGILAVESNPAVCMGMILAGSIGITILFKSEEHWW